MTDVLLVAQLFVRRYGGSLGRPDLALGDEAAACLRRHDWPGNVRELARTVESAVALCPGRTIDVPHLPLELRPGRSTLVPPFHLDLDAQSSVDLPRLLSEFEDAVIAWALRRANGQQTRAAALLGVPRTTLQSKLARPANDGAARRRAAIAWLISCLPPSDYHHMGRASGRLSNAHRTDRGSSRVKPS